MFKLNLLSITIWVLGGILLFVAIGLIIWRSLFKEKHKKDYESKNIGSVSNDFNDMIISLYSTTNYNIIHNILIKNKYSSRKFSIIPAIVFTENNAFLLTNSISSNKYSEVLFEKDSNNPIYLKRNKEVKITNIQKKWTKEILKYLEKKFPLIHFNVVIPVIGDSLNVNCQWENFKPIKQMSFETDLNNYSPSKISKQEIITVAKHLSSANLFKEKISAEKNSIKKGRLF